MSFLDNIYSQYLQKSLNDLRAGGISCDVILIVGEREFQAHKSVLAAASPYFSAMFNPMGAFKESKEDRITLHDVDGEAVAAILEFIYTSNVKITEENVYHLMEASNLFQIYALRVWISNYLQNTITPDNCLSLYVKAVLHDYYDLAQAALTYVKENFSRVAEGDEFLEMPANVFIKLLSSKFLNVTDETVLVKYVLRWINVDAEKRREHGVDLISNIELANIPVQALVELKNDPLFKTSFSNKVEEYLKEQISRRCTSNVKYCELSTKWETVRYGSEQGIILAIGGESSGVASRNVECFTVGYHSWKCVIPQYILSNKGPQNLTVIPAMRCARYNAAAAHDSYNVHVMGGRSSSDYLDECETFNIQKCRWTSFKSMPRKLEGGGAVLFEGRLVVVGGRNDLGCTGQAWEWDKGNKSWKNFPALNSPRSFHGMIALGGYIFALGGFDKDQETALRTGERYDPSLRRWFEIRSMQKARAKFGCAVVDNCIYVLGGIDENCGLKSVEKYNLETNEWCYVAPMLVPRHSFSVAVYKKNIFCIGGSDTVHYLHSVDKFNPFTNRWHFLLSMQMSRYGLVSATLLVPYITVSV